MPRRPLVQNGIQKDDNDNLLNQITQNKEDDEEVIKDEITNNMLVKGKPKVSVDINGLTKKSRKKSDKHPKNKNRNSKNQTRFKLNEDCVCTCKKRKRKV